MKKHTSKVLALLLALVMLLGLMAGCTGEDSPTDNSESPSEQVDQSYPITPEELGSGTVKWSEKKTADGWVEVTNDGGETLGYSPDSGVELIQVEGLAFKDLNRNGLLDAYEDWRLDDDARAGDLASQLPVEAMIPLLIHGDWDTFGSSLGEQDLACLDGGVRAGLTRSATTEGNTKMAVTWVNLMQVYAETNGGFGIPVTISADPSGMSGIIEQVSVAATMNTELVNEIAQEVAKEYRAVGITMLLGPQVDISSNTLWSRAYTSYSEDPALNRDLANAYISGLQSTYDENGADLGWGTESVISVVKHFAGAGASEGGRDDHNDYGNYTVFPGNNFNAHLIAFLDGAFKLDSVTGYAAGVMPNYGIAYSEDGSLGELVGGAYSEYKMDILRENGYDGYILTDWVGQVKPDFPMDGPMIYGVENLSVAERYYKMFKNGVTQVGGTIDLVGPAEGYELLAEDLGEEEAEAWLRDTVAHFLVTQFHVGLYENPYISAEKAASTAWTDDSKAYGAETQEQAVVMLKNSDDTIREQGSSEGKPTVYIPYTLITTGSKKAGYVTTCEPVVDIELASEYFNVVTDSIGEPSGEDGLYTIEDIIRPSAQELAACDYVLMDMIAPYVAGTTDEDGNYLPASLQYEQYTADSEAVRKEAIANGSTFISFVDTYGVTRTEEVEGNRSYYGNTAALPGSYSDYELLKYVAGAVSESCKIIVVMEMSACPAMVWSEVEPLADVIFMHFGTSRLASGSLLKLVTGQVEPSALLPVQQPASMEAAEAQLEDVPRDTERYVDSNGNTYDFGFGLNWSGVIQDERTATYCVPALTAPENAANG